MRCSDWKRQPEPDRAARESGAGRPAYTSPLPLSLQERGFAARFRKLIPAIGTSRIIPRIPSRGAADRRHADWRGGCGACGRGLRLAPGRLREPTWGHYDPCARSSLDCAGCTSRRDGSAARSFQIAAWRSATGRADGDPSAPLPGSMEADTKPAPRGAPLPLIYDNARRGACGRGRRLGAGGATCSLSPCGRGWGEGARDLTGLAFYLRPISESVARPLIRRCAPPSPARGEGKRRASHSLLGANRRTPHAPQSRPSRRDARGVPAP